MLKINKNKIKIILKFNKPGDENDREERKKSEEGEVAGGVKRMFLKNNFFKNIL